MDESELKAVDALIAVAITMIILAIGGLVVAAVIEAFTSLGLWAIPAIALFLWGFRIVYRKVEKFLGESS